jgi:YYY domain-containing protein
MLAYFLIEGWVAYRRAGVLRSIRLFVANWELTPRIIRLQSVLVRRQSVGGIVVGYGIAAAVLVVSLATLAGMALSGVLVVLLVAALVLGLRRDRSVEDCFVFLLFGTALAISIGTEQVVIDGDVGRMNTIFKFYEQIWVLYGIAGAVAVYRIHDRLATVRSHWPGRAWVVVLVAFILMSAVYPVLGTKSRVSQRFDPTIPPTLDGMAYMDSAVYTDTDESTHLTGQLHFATDKAAIEWLQDHVDGTPTIVEGTRPLYRWGSRISIYTGLPTVIGWDWHQKQQRWGFQTTVDDRIADVQRIYQDPSVDRTMALLQQYDVKYIIEGELERAFYPRSSEKFDSLVGSRLSVAYDQSGVKIYQVQ